MNGLESSPVQEENKSATSKQNNSQRLRKLQLLSQFKTKPYCKAFSKTKNVKPFLNKNARFSPFLGDKSEKMSTKSSQVFTLPYFTCLE